MTPHTPDLTPVQIIANPAVTIGRAFTDTFACIAPVSVPGFVLAQLAGAVLGVAAAAGLYPGVASVADDAVVPHGSREVAR